MPSPVLSSVPLSVPLLALLSVPLSALLLVPLSVPLSALSLALLSVGSHTFEIIWTDGSASTSFTIVKNASDTDDKQTKTGDDFDLTLCIALLMALLLVPLSVPLSALSLALLSVGSHTFEIIWTDGSASTSFTIVKNASDTDDKQTKTGDDFDLTLCIALLMASLTGAVVTLDRKRKHNK